MAEIRTKQFQLLSDISTVWKLMTENYVPECRNGIAAPFFEYALTSSWFDARYTYLNRLWLDGSRAVGFVFYESPVSCIFFHLLPGYEYLADEMVAYADTQMRGSETGKELVLFPGQTALMEAAQKRGYRLEWVQKDWLLDLRKGQLKADLPEGFHFVDSSKADPVKLAACTWKGFDHEDKGPFENWDGEETGEEWTPQKSYRGVNSSFMAPPPHATFEHNVIIANEKEEYVCFSGMWWVPENHLAYMEPLCTVPQYRRRGLALAALAEHDRRMRGLGAEYMTGGGDAFYLKAGYNAAMEWQHWKKPING